MTDPKMTPDELAMHLSDIAKTHGAALTEIEFQTYTGAAVNISIACSVPATQDADFEALEWTPVRTGRSVPIQGIRQ